MTAPERSFGRKKAVISPLRPSDATRSSNCVITSSSNGWSLGTSLDRSHQVRIGRRVDTTSIQYGASPPFCHLPSRRVTDSLMGIAGLVEARRLSVGHRSGCGSKGQPAPSGRESLASARVHPRSNRSVWTQDQGGSLRSACRRTSSAPKVARPAKNLARRLTIRTRIRGATWTRSVVELDPGRRRSRTPR
jgi:hypothetical protein